MSHDPCIDYRSIDYCNYIEIKLAYKDMCHLKIVFFSKFWG